MVNRIVEEIVKHTLDSTPDYKGRYQVSLGKGHPYLSMVINQFMSSGYRVTRFYGHYMVTLFIYPITEE